MEKEWLLSFPGILSEISRSLEILILHPLEFATSYGILKRRRLGTFDHSFIIKKKKKIPIVLKR